MRARRRRIIIVGAGPAGLGFARALSECDAEILIVERQPRAALADPAPDGREIALTRRSVRYLRELGVWPLISPDDVHPLREARVQNGRLPFAMRITPAPADTAPLGVLVSNHCIREAMYRCVMQQGNVHLRARTSVTTAEADADGVRVLLDDGSRIDADLLVAADSRFSSLRAAMQIGAEIEPVERTMLVGRVRHPALKSDVATEWFAQGRTIAMLALKPGLSSLVLTLPTAEAEAVLAQSREGLERALYLQTAGRWGRLTLDSELHAYPLTITCAHRFSGPRFALIGDAAVGMHPVTAHGFNFGLSGAVRLARLVAAAPDVGSSALLRRYSIAHRAETWGLYQATRALVGLFTYDRPHAMIARHALIHAGAARPARRLLRSILTQ